MEFQKEVHTVTASEASGGIAYCYVTLAAGSTVKTVNIMCSHFWLKCSVELSRAAEAVGNTIAFFADQIQPGDKNVIWHGDIKTGRTYKVVAGAVKKALAGDVVYLTVGYES